MIKPWTANKLKWLNAKIKHNWERLSDEEIDSYQDRPDVFYDAVKHKYGMFKDDAQRRMKQLKAGYHFFNW